MKSKQLISMIMVLVLTASVLGKYPKAVFAEAKTNVKETTVEFTEQRLVPPEECWKYEEWEETISIKGFDDENIYSIDDYEKDEENGVGYCLVVPTEIQGKKVRYVSLHNNRGTNRKIMSVELPPTLESIPDCAFLDMFDLTHITIPDNVTEIGYSAFSGCQNLLSIDLPECLQSIGEEAFNGCWSLEKMVIPARVSHIEYDAFKDCRGMESYVVKPDNEGGYYAEDDILYKKWIEEVPVYGHETDEDGEPIVDFYREVEKKVLISYPGAKKGVYNLGANTDFSWCAFLNAKSLTTINVDSENQDYTSMDGVVYTKNMKELCVFPAGKNGEYTVPEGVCSLQAGSFSSSSLTALHLPDSLGESYLNEWGEDTIGFIDGYPLFECDNLQTLTLGKNITTKLLRALLDVHPKRLKNIKISEKNPYLSAVDNIVYDKKVKELVYIPAGIQGRLVLPDTVETAESAGGYDFWAWRAGGEGITEIVLGVNYVVTTQVYSEDGEKIYEYAKGMPQMEYIQSFEVSSSNQTLAAYDGLLYSKDLKTLYYCPAAKEGTVTIPEGTTKILGDVFSDCSADKLKEIVIPASVTDIQCGWDMNYSNITIKCSAGSVAEEFAKKNGANIVIIPSGASATQKPEVTTSEVTTQSPQKSPSPTPTKKPSVSKRTSTPYTTKSYVVKAPGKAKLKKAKALGKQKVKVSWKWSVSQDGYQLQYAMDRSFTKNRKTQNKSAMADAATIKNLKKGKTYYFRVRAYRARYYGGKKYGKWGKWSNVKKCRVK